MKMADDCLILSMSVEDMGDVIETKRHGFWVQKTRSTMQILVNRNQPIGVNPRASVADLLHEGVSFQKIAACF
jgi:hypothetical protein